MSPIRRIIPGLLTMLVLSAVLASSAAAASPAWWVTGTPLAAGSTAAVAETTTVTTPFSIEATGIQFECGSIKAEKAYIEGEKTAKMKSIVFKECKASESSSCTIPTTISTLPLTATLEGTSKHFKLHFAPTEGKRVEVVDFTGEKCALAGDQPLEGTMACNYPGVETESIIHILEFTAGSGSVLKLASKEATLEGIDEFWLSPERKWSVK